MWHLVISINRGRDFLSSSSGFTAVINSEWNGSPYSSSCVVSQNPEMVMQAFADVFIPHPGRPALWVWFLRSPIWQSGFYGHTVGQPPLVCQFKEEEQRKLPSVRSLAPSWDLPTVLKAISQAPFELLEQVDMKMVSLKVALVIALTSAERVREMHALSENNACRQTAPGGLSVQLKFWMINDSMSGLYIREGWWPLQHTRHQSQRNVTKSFC